MKTLKDTDIDKIVTWFRSKASITTLVSKILNWTVKNEKRDGNIILLRFYDLPDPVKTLVRMEVSIIGKDEKSTNAELRKIDEAVFNEFANASLPLEIDGFYINNIVPRQAVPDLGTKDRKEFLRDYLFYF